MQHDLFFVVLITLKKYMNIKTHQEFIGVGHSQGSGFLFLSKKENTTQQ